MAVKRSSLFGSAAPKLVQSGPADIEASAPPLPAAQVDPTAPKYPKAKTREGKRVATAYLDREAFRQLQKIVFDEETTMQALLLEGVNAVFAARGMSRIA